jgi:hypothetical protein
VAGQPLPPGATLDEITLRDEGPAAATPPGEVGPGAECCPPAEKKPFWATRSPVTPMPLLGAWIIPPTGPGYYSLWDLVRGEERSNPPRFPYGPYSLTPFSFFDADFRYLDDPANMQRDWLFDHTKRLHLGDDWLFSIGGEERIRYMNEVDGYVRFTGRDNVYELERSRVYGDLWYRDVFRVYVEYIDAAISNNDLTPLPTDVNHSDLLNLFLDIKVAEVDGHPVYVRGGRQELLYGSQRLISPLDWVNTRRTFEGVKGFWHSDQLDIDAFWVKPVIPDPTHFDAPDSRVNFSGVWTTYRPVKGQSVDLYYLDLDNPHHLALGEYGDRSGYNVSTVGSRYRGEWNHLLWDTEGMYQFGNWANQQIAAGAYTVGGGCHFAELPLNPEFWLYWDWAEGDPHPGSGGVRRTFNQLFPFGHYYFGYLDLVGRENIQDLNMQLTLFPTKWWGAGMQYHVFHLDSPRDALYNAAGVPIRSDPTGGAGTSVGDEIDVFTNFHLSAHQDILLGYSKLYAGNFLKHSPGVPAGNPHLFYLQYSLKW